MNELEKCMAGEWYDCHDEIFLEYKNNTISKKQSKELVKYAKIINNIDDNMLLIANQNMKQNQIAIASEI